MFEMFMEFEIAGIIKLPPSKALFFKIKNKISAAVCNNIAYMQSGKNLSSAFLCVKKKNIIIKGKITADSFVNNSSKKKSVCKNKKIKWCLSIYFAKNIKDGKKKIKNSESFLPGIHATV